MLAIMKKIPVVIVGLNFGQYIIKQIIEGPGKDYYEIVGLCDLDKGLLRKLSEELDIRAYSDIELALKDPTVHLVGLFCGPTARPKIIEQIIDAGKDVITTKPFSFDYEVTRKLFDKASLKNRIIHLNSPTPELSEDIRQIKAWEKDYNLGPVIACQASTWIRYHEKQTDNWMCDPELCPVAPISRIGIYTISDLVSLMGEVEDMNVLSSQIFTERRTPDNAMLSILFKNKSIASVLASFCIDDGQKYHNYLMLNYEKGTIYRKVHDYTTHHECKSNVANVQLVMKDENGESKTVQDVTFESSSGDYQWANLYKAIYDRTPSSQDEYYNRISLGVKVLDLMRKASNAPTYELEAAGIK